MKIPVSVTQNDRRQKSAKRGSHLVVLPDATYKYYKRQNSITTRAKRHVKGLCSCLADNPTSPALREATGLFLTTLRACGDTKNALLLRISAILSRFAPGRFTLRLAEEIVGRIVWR